jgi:hypothetical protein
MHDAGGVGGHEHTRDLPGDRDLLVALQAGVYRGAKRPPFDVLEDDPVVVGCCEVIVDAADLRVIELGEHPRLSDEPSARLWIQAPLGANGLQRDAALQCLIDGEIDLPHAAFADGMQYAVAGGDQVGGHGVGCLAEAAPMILGLRRAGDRGRRDHGRLGLTPRRRAAAAAHSAASSPAACRSSCARRPPPAGSPDDRAQPGWPYRPHGPRAPAPRPRWCGLN